ADVVVDVVRSVRDAGGGDHVVRVAVRLALVGAAVDAEHSGRAPPGGARPAHARRLLDRNVLVFPQLGDDDLLVVALAVALVVALALVIALTVALVVALALVVTLAVALALVIALTVALAVALATAGLLPVARGLLPVARLPATGLLAAGLLTTG